MRANSDGRTINALCLAACGAMALAAGTARAAEVTYERLVNPEPQDWLMNHHDFGSQRYSVLDTINKSNVKNLRLAFAVALGGTSGNENLTATPLVDDGFMYVTDAWGVVYKIDVRSGKAGDIVWKMDPGQEEIDRNRGMPCCSILVGLPCPSAC
jgi:alcohol dehydrogenase (cytochrome c)